MKNNNEKLCELHVHLEGCLWENHFRKNWNTSSFLFPPISYFGNSPDPFGRFLAQLRFGYNFLNGVDKYVSVFNDYLEYMEEQHIVYSEMQINYALIKIFGIDLKVLLGEFYKILGQKNRFIRFIIDLPWQFSSSSFEEIIVNSEEYKELGVVAISMGGDENFARPKEVAEVFNLARDVNLKLLCHAGETTNSSFARNIVKELNPDRIAHGISIAEWLVDSYKTTPKIDICLTSNFELEVVKTISEHPLEKWLESGAFFSLSTDDPAIFNTTLANEYNIAEITFETFYKYKNKYKEHILECSFDKEKVHSLLFG